jgi:NAD(P)-dependent dehydrogenase (short-subunit alcohol dehydrogenase family)
VAGAEVALVDIDRPSAERTLELVATAGGRGEVFVADVTDRTAARALVQAVLERLARLDILVNNVGVLGPTGDVAALDPDAFDQLLHTNVTSMLITTQSAIPALEASGGCVVNVGSIAGLIGTSGPVAYATSKAAIAGMTRNLAGALGPRGIRVNCVAPGNVYTPMVAGGMTAEVREARRLSNPLRREGTAWDVAGAVVYLASDAASWVTGVVLPVDGGFTAHAATAPAYRPPG